MDQEKEVMSVVAPAALRRRMRYYKRLTGMALTAQYNMTVAQFLDSVGVPSADKLPPDSDDEKAE